MLHKNILQTSLIVTTLFLSSNRFVSSSNNANTDKNPTRVSSSYGDPKYPKDLIHGETREYIEKLRNSFSSSEGTEDDFVLDTNPLLLLSETLTLTGYKGGSVESQINQDRSFIVRPFLFSSSFTQNDEDGNDCDAGTDGNGECINNNDNNNNNNNLRKNKETDEENIQIMKDIEKNDKSIILGVFDGHGYLGEVVSQHAVTTVPTLLSEKLHQIYLNYDIDDGVDKDGSTALPLESQIKQAIHDTFIETDQSTPTNGVGGCTASIILQLGQKIYIANAGDSFSFIIAIKKQQKESSENNNKAYVLYETREDKPHLASERERIEKMGGHVYIPTKEEEDLGDSSRVYFISGGSKKKKISKVGDDSMDEEEENDEEEDEDEGHYVGLAMSRSLGDWDAKKAGVISDPTVDVLDLSRGIDSLIQDKISDYDSSNSDSSNEDWYLFAVSASDGLMDYTTPQEVADKFVHEFLAYTNNNSEEENEDDPQFLSALLTSLCYDLVVHSAMGWYDDEHGSYRDDIAIAISELNYL